MLKESVEMHAPAAVKESVEAGHVAKGQGISSFGGGVEVSVKTTPDMNAAFAYSDILIHRLVYDGMLKFHGFLK